MAGVKISAQTAAAAKLTTDKLAIARGGVGYGVTNVDTDVTANTGSAYTIDQANGSAFNLTLNAALPILTLQTAPTAGTTTILYVRLIQDGTGGRVPTFANVTWAAVTPPAIAQAIGAITYLSFAGNGGVWTGFAALQAGDNLTITNLTSTGIQTFTGVTNASTASAGKVGEVISSTIAIASATSLTTATAKSITSISLTAGDWEVWGNIGFIAAAGTLATILEGSISTLNNTQATSPNGGAYFRNALAYTVAETQICPIGRTIINISATATYYLVGTATFSVSTLTAYGAIFARRIR